MSFVLLFIIGLGTGLSGAMIPGPLFLFTVSESLKKDATVGLRIAVGHIMIEALFVVMIFLGFKSMLTSQGFMHLISGLGGVALIGMGIILLYGAAQMSLQVEKGVEFDYGAVIGGAFFSIISPGFLIWWSTIGLSVVLKSLLFGLLGLATVALGHWMADIGWHWFVSYYIHKKMDYMDDRLYRNIVRLLAFGLVAAGVYFCYSFII
ncbi:MAG: LysE family transporter [Candidatus Omnitrophica bacterium]|nr:LysE family transporter [Candidatus Omnitrophota bacterium]